jgi:hypothetical protein
VYHLAAMAILRVSYYANTSLSIFVAKLSWDAVRSVVVTSVVFSSVFGGGIVASIILS